MRASQLKASTEKRTKFDILRREVIEAGYCHLCGACTAFCDRIILTDAPRLGGICVIPCESDNGCLCYSHCPMVSLVSEGHIFDRTGEDRALGIYQGIRAAKTKIVEISERAQDGGAVTSILYGALKHKAIDAAIVMDRDKCWRPVPGLVKSVKLLLNTCGSTYTPAPVVSLLGRAVRDRAKGHNRIRKLAIVGTPCQIQAVRNVEYGILYNCGFSPISDLKIYTIGLFCEGVFHYDRMMDTVGVDAARIKRMEIKKSLTVNRRTRIPLSRLKDALLESCKICMDYSSELADISIGSAGTKEGWSTLVLRSDRGAQLLRDSRISRYVNINQEVDVTAIHNRAIIKKRRSWDEICNRRASGMPLPPIWRCESGIS
ncbi:Coenzyme F420 hydrogenase/dehydrogenase, beta subunit C-terminal domain [Candidatus Pyrohabitans sp.]